MNSGVKVRPIVESGNRTQSFLDALMTVEIVVSVKSPSVEAREQDDTVEGGGVVRCIETDKNSIDKTVASGGGANPRVEIGSVGEPGGKEIGGTVGQVSVNMAVLVASALSGNNLGESRRAREGGGTSGGAASARMERRMRTEGGNVRRGGIRVTRSIGDEGRREKRNGVGEDTANLGTEPPGRYHGAARACRVDGEGGDAGTESLLDKASENARRKQNARRKLRVEVNGGGKGNEGGRAKVGRVGWRTRVGEKGGESKAGKAGVALCESRARGRRSEEGGCGLVWIHDEGLVKCGKGGIRRQKEDEEAEGKISSGRQKCGGKKNVGSSECRNRGLNSNCLAPPRFSPPLNQGNEGRWWR